MFINVFFRIRVTDIRRDRSVVFVLSFIVNDKQYYRVTKISPFGVFLLYQGFATLTDTGVSAAVYIDCPHLRPAGENAVGEYDGVTRDEMSRETVSTISVLHTGHKETGKMCSSIRCFDRAAHLTYRWPP